MAHYAGVAIAANVINQNARQRWNDIYRTGVLHEIEFTIKLFPREATVACAFVMRLVYRQEKRAPHAG
jgi:hypothetical protein